MFRGGRASFLAPVVRSDRPGGCVDLPEAFIPSGWSVGGAAGEMIYVNALVMLLCHVAGRVLLSAVAKLLDERSPVPGTATWARPRVRPGCRVPSKRARNRHSRPMVVRPLIWLSGVWPLGCLVAKGLRRAAIEGRRRWGAPDTVPPMMCVAPVGASMERSARAGGYRRRSRCGSDCLYRKVRG